MMLDAESRLIKQHLKAAFPDLTDDLLNKLASTVQIRTYPRESILCIEGGHENTFYIILAGQVSFSKKMGAEDHFLRHGNAGEFFGEMALLDEKSGRSATVKTTQATQVLEIEREVFENLVRQAPTVVLPMAKTIIQRMRENDTQAITELQAQKQAIETAYADLQDLHRQREIFLNTLAHELRTPLTSIMGYMQLVRGGLMSGIGLQMSLEKIGSGLDRLVSLINDLFFLQSVETLAPRFQPTRIADILGEVVIKAQPHAHKQKVRLELELPSKLPIINAETDGLVRAFGHLVDNAIKFSPDGGEVLIKAEQYNDGVRVQIIDHGVGISPDFMPHLFDGFEREEKFGEHLFDGAGVGMPIVKRIVEMHLGTIRVQSQRGLGSTFIIDLPANLKRSSTPLDTLRATQPD